MAGRIDPEWVFSQLRDGKSRDAIARELGIQRKSLDQAMRRAQPTKYVWDEEVQFYVPEAQKQESPTTKDLPPKKVLRIIADIEKGDEMEQVILRHGLSDAKGLGRYMSLYGAAWSKDKGNFVLRSAGETSSIPDTEGQGHSTRHTDSPQRRPVNLDGVDGIQDSGTGDSAVDTFHTVSPGTPKMQISIHIDNVVVNLPASYQTVDGAGLAK